MYNTFPGAKGSFLREIDQFLRQISVFYVKLTIDNWKLAQNKLISRKFDPLMNHIRILYLTKGLGKYKILSLVRVKITSPRGLQGHKIPSLAAYGRSGRYFI